MYDFIKSYAHIKWEEFMQLAVPVHGPSGSMVFD